MHGILFNREPFCNCQNFSLENFENILDNAGSDEEIIKTVKIFQKTANKKMLVIDIHTEKAEKARKLFNMVVDAPYTSTNGSEMSLMMINLSE